MEIVRYDAQERVDLPDITAMSFLVLGEFRRHVRGLLIGPGAGSPAYPNYILQGYAVEPQAVPDATIRVRLQIAGQPLAFAIGAENLATRIDHGQLIGGDGLDGSLEGNASQSLDFTGQPPATYTVQMRFVYQDGDNDNRAFWDQGLNSEFLTATNTRHLPLIELRFDGVASDEWLDLAEVVWGGATVMAGNITDVRVFVMEGQDPFRAATQAGLNSGNILPDFDRSALRGDPGVGINTVYPALRALARQIADIKGQDDAGYFGWWQRVYGPTDALDALTDDQTRSLQTVDHVMFTIGDGTDTWGDFNGLSGLEDCLQHIEDMGVNTPSSIQIVCKARNTTSPTRYTWEVTSPHTINGVCARLTIDFQGHRMSYTGTAATTAIAMALGELEIRNLSMNASPSNNATIFSTGVGAPVRLINSTVFGDTSSSAAFAVIGGAGSFLEQTSVNGGVQFLSGGTPAGTDDSYNDPVIVEGGRFFWMEVGNTPSGERITPLHVRSAQFRAQANYGRDAVLDLNNNKHCKVENCIFDFVAVSHAIELAVANSIQPSGNVIRDCRFVHSEAAVAFTNHYAVRLSQADDTIIAGCEFVLDDDDGGGVLIVNSDRVLIEGCFFDGQSTTGRADIDSAVVFDSAGADCYYNTIKNCRFRDWEPNVTGGGNGRTIRNAISTPGIVGLVIEGCHFEDCGGYSIDMSSAAGTVGALTVANCQWDINTANGEAIDIENAVNPVLTGNTLLFTSGATVGVMADGVAGGVASGNRMVNGVFSTTTAVLWGVAGGGGPTNLNYVT